MAAPVPVYDPWTGFYAGINIGYSWGRTKSDYTSLDPASGNTETNHDTADIDGVIGGGQVGYNYRFDQVYLVGLEADFQGSGEHGSPTTQICHPGSVPGAICDFGNIWDKNDETLKWFGTVRGRLGYLVTPNLLTYATGGFAYGKLTRNDTYTYFDDFFCNAGPAAGNCTPQNNSISATKTGWTIGGGVEGKIWGNWSGRIEYLYLQLDGLGTSTFNLTSGNPPLVVLTTTTHAFSDNILRVGLNYQFGH
jgi:outer membrane immunogenic protein